MQLNAKLISLLPLQTGNGKNGTWKKQDIIVETDGQYPKKVCISIWGDKIDEKKLVPGNRLKIDFDVESREYNGRWYTDVKAWRIDTEGEQAPEAASSIDTPHPEDDLPF
ncbi:MAG: DUF3127 domain-containing protein [Bacteroidetes bacterium]|nr:DUF3127 domain-containing protein [Bacteroidota bacterium]